MSLDRHGTAMRILDVCAATPYHTPMSQDTHGDHEAPSSPPVPTPLSGDTPAAAPVTRGFPPRLLAATAAGAAVAVPMGWLLAHAAMLVFYLGLFFFALFGLLIGAVEFRIARPVAPLARSSLLVVGLLTVLWTWLVAMAFEYHNLTSDVRTFVWNTFRTIDAEAAQQIDALPARLQENLRRSYPPGGLIGYMRWAARSGRMEVGKLPNNRPIEFRLRQGPRGWSLRVALCAGLLTFGVLSQVLSLADAPKPADEGEGGETGPSPPQTLAN